MRGIFLVPWWWWSWGPGDDLAVPRVGIDGHEDAGISPHLSPAKWTCWTYPGDVDGGVFGRLGPGLQQREGRSEPSSGTVSPRPGLADKQGNLPHCGPDILPHFRTRRP